MKIHKYIIEVDAHREGFYIAEVEMPRRAKPISCGPPNTFFSAHFDKVSIWAVIGGDIDGENQKVVHRFGVLGTGVSEIEPEELAEGNFLGTVQNGPAVWHIFDLGEK